MVVRQDDFVVVCRERIERLDDARQDGAPGDCGTTRSAALEATVMQC